MSRANPKKALAALLPLPISAGGFTVRPMTLAMWAALESIDSPLLAAPADDAQAALDLIPSLYLLTHGAEQIFRRDFSQAAFSWADSVPVSAILDIKRAAVAQLRVVSDVIPEADPEKPPKKATGRSPSSRAGRPETQAGRGEKSSSTSRLPPSASCVGKTGSTPIPSSLSK